MPAPERQLEAWSWPPRYDPAYRPSLDQRCWFPVRETIDPEEREVAQTARRSFREYSKYIVEIMRLPHLSDADLDRLVEVEGADNFRRALEHGKGIIFVSAHFGNFELGGVHIADVIAPLTVLADDLGMKRVFDMLLGHRRKRDVHLVTEGMARAALSALRRNELVGLMMDLGPRANAFDTVRGNFCGRETVFPAVAAQLLRMEIEAPADLPRLARA